MGLVGKRLAFIKDDDVDKDDVDKINDDAVDDDDDDDEDDSGRAEESPDLRLLLPRRDDICLHKPYHVKIHCCVNIILVSHCHQDCPHHHQVS